MTSVKFVYDNEIRRASVGEEGGRVRFNDLVQAVWDLFPQLRDSGFSFQWTDDEGDLVALSVERELEEALRVSESSGRLLRLTISPSQLDHSDLTQSGSGSTSTPKIIVVHEGVTCDECGVTPIKGIRYKCTVRNDFDLCETCEAKAPQPFPMIKISDPSTAPHFLMYGFREHGHHGRGRGHGRGFGAGGRGEGCWRRARGEPHHPHPHPPHHAPGHMPPPPFGGGCPFRGPHGPPPAPHGPAPAGPQSHMPSPALFGYPFDRFSKRMEKAQSRLKGADFAKNPLAPFVAAVDALFGEDENLPKAEANCDGVHVSAAPAATAAPAADDDASMDVLLERAIEESLREAVKPVHVETAPAPVPTLPKPALRYVRDVTLPDNTTVQPGVVIRKVWRVRNDGKHPWPADAALVTAGGDLLTPENLREVLPIVGPEEEADIAVNLQAPRANGLYTAYFRAQTKEGQHFGHRLWASIVVADQEPDWQVLSSMETQPTPESASDPAPTPAAEEPASVPTPTAPSEAAAEVHVTGESKAAEDGEPEEHDMLEGSQFLLSSSQLPPADAQVQSLALLWRRELEILGDMGFHDLEVILPLLQTHFAVPVSLSSDKNGTPRPEGMQQVIAALLTQSYQV